MPSPPLTYDNGKEFAYHQTLPRDSTPKATSPPLPFLERGLNENTNGLIRQYLPKGPISALSHLRRSAASWTDSTTGRGNVLASRFQISYSQESNHLLHLRVESTLEKMSGTQNRLALV